MFAIIKSFFFFFMDKKNITSARAHTLDQCGTFTHKWERFNFMEAIGFKSNQMKCILAIVTLLSNSKI